MFARRGTPKRRGYGDLFADWEKAVARECARRARRQFSSLRWQYGLEDLVQEALIHWFQVRGRYREDRGASRKTYMGKVVHNRMLELARHEETDIRRANAVAESLSGLAGGQDDSFKYDIEDQSIHPDDFDLRERFQTAADQLTDRQKRILDLYADETIVGIADNLGVCRDTVYAEVKRIRKVFQDKGLKDFIE